LNDTTTTSQGPVHVIMPSHYPISPAILAGKSCLCILRQHTKLDHN